MSGINLSDESHTTISNLSYEHHTSRKDIVEKMLVFTMEHKKEFLKEMFEKKEE